MEACDIITPLHTLQIESVAEAESETESETEDNIILQANIHINPNPQFCYILHCPGSKATYNGYTVCPSRRIRQHNGEIRGGAKATQRCSPRWEYAVIITSPDPTFTKHKAMSLEWSIHYPTNKRPRPKEYSGILGRIKSLSLVFANQKFAGIPLNIYVADQFLEAVRVILAPYEGIHKLYHLYSLKDFSENV